MRKRWRLFLIVILVLAVGGLLVVPSVRWPVYGWLQGEAFYRGMPASWWAKEIETGYSPVFVAGEPTWSVATPASVWDQLWQRVIPGKTAIPVMDSIIGGPLLDGDVAALPMLLPLTRSKVAKVRRVAISGLLAQGKQRSEAVQAVLMMIEDPDDEVRRDAMAAWQQLDPQAAAEAGIK